MNKWIIYAADEKENKGRPRYMAAVSTELGARFIANELNLHAADAGSGEIRFCTENDWIENISNVFE